MKLTSVSNIRRRTEHTKLTSKRLIIHVGLHKTGTTSVQSLLASQADRLKQDGLLYPVYGRPEGLAGHHNIAWELAGDHRFDRKNGTVDEIATEISDFVGDSLISSEDFESILNTPDRFLPIISHQKLLNHKVELLLYIRDQASYAESLFLELLKHGYKKDFSSFAEEILHTRSIEFSDWIFQFGYRQIYAKLYQAGLGRIVIRSYHRLFGGSTITDLLRTLRFSSTSNFEVNYQRFNERATLGQSLSQFYGLYSGDDPASLEKRFQDMLGPELEKSQPTLTLPQRKAFGQRFAFDNRVLLFKNGLNPFSSRLRHSRHESLLSISDFFSLKTCKMLDDLLGDRITDFEARQTLGRNLSSSFVTRL